MSEEITPTTRSADDDWRTYVGLFAVFVFGLCCLIGIISLVESVRPKLVGDPI